MEKPVFYIVDVFAERKYAGNQLAVFRNTESLSDSEMQKIAKEMNYSETTFILSEEEKNGGYDVRIFTPEAELPFAGHPTVGTAFVIQKEIVKKQVQTIILNLKVGQIPVAFTYSGEETDILWMKQNAPTFGVTLDSGQIAKSLSLDKEDIDDKFPIQEVSTGFPFIIAPLKTQKALEKSKAQLEIFFDLIEKLEAKNILVFCSQTYKPENDLCVRVYADYYGIPEDPATGSGNGCLAGYLAKHRYFGKSKIDARVEQGYQIGRPSLLFLKAEDKGTEIEVKVGGKVVMIARGELI